MVNCSNKQSAKQTRRLFSFVNRWPNDTTLMTRNKNTDSAAMCDAPNIRKFVLSSKKGLKLISNTKWVPFSSIFSIFSSNLSFVLDTMSNNNNNSTNNKFHTSALSPSATAVGLFLAANDSTIKFETSSYELTPGLWETRKSRILFDLNPNRRVPGSLLFQLVLFFSLRKNLKFSKQF